MNRMRRYVATVFVAGLLGLGGPAVAQQTQPSSDQPAGADAAESANAAVPKSQRRLQQARRHYQSGRWLQAAKHYEQAFNAAEAATKLKTTIALEWGNLLWQQGDYTHAKRRVDQALEMARKLDMNEAIGQLLLTKGHIEASRGKLKEAERTLKICIQMAADQQDAVFSSLCQINHRLVRQLRSRPAGPQSDYRKAIARLQAAGTPLTVGASMAKTAQLYAEAGQTDRALSLLKNAQAEFDRADSVPAQLRNRLRIAKLLQAQGRHGQARRYFKGLVERFAAMNNRPAWADALEVAAADAKHRGDIERAAQLYGQALNVAEQTTSPSLIARQHLALCEFGVNTGQPATVADHCKVAASEFGKLDTPELAARSTANLGQVYQARGDLNKASSAYSAAIQTLEHVGVPGTADTPGITRYRANLCQVQMTLRAKGSLSVCKLALDALHGQANPEPSMLAATEYAVGVSAGRDSWAGRGLKHLAKAADLAESMDPPDHRLAADALLRRGVILAKHDDHQDDAAKAFGRGLDIVDHGSGAAVAATGIELRTQLAQLRLSGRKWAAAKDQLTKLIEAADNAPDKKAWAYSALARAQLKLGNEQAAKKALQTGLGVAKEAGDAELADTMQQNLAQFE